MKIAIATDLHWGVRNNSPLFLNQQEKFFYSCFIPFLEEHNIKNVWILGDFYDNRKNLNILILNRAHLFLEKLQSLGIKVYCILGNHDVHYKNTNVINSIDPLKKTFECFSLIEETAEIDFDRVKGWIHLLDNPRQ